MILIISDSNDRSTGHVTDYLDYLDKKWIRINKEDLLDIEFKGNDIILKKLNQSVRISEIKSCWYRRGYLNYWNKYKTGIHQFDFLQHEEINAFLEFIYYKLKEIKHINSIDKADVNKLIVSALAKEIGIHTPEDLIVSDEKYLEKNLKEPDA